MNRLCLLRAFVLSAIALPLSSPCRLFAEADSRLSNLSSRASASNGANALIAGFSISGPGPKEILVRAIGPGLAKFGVSGLLSAPRLQLFDADGRQIHSNEKWDAALKSRFSQVGAFALTDNSKDAALLVTLQPGTYTAQVTGINNGSGVALVEIYEVSGASRLVNLSTRARIATGSGVVISGIVVAQGSGARRILVRGVGPGLKPFGIGDAVVDPVLAVLNSAGQQIATNNNWYESAAKEELSIAQAAAGAFPFAEGSKDSALVVDLTPGNYSIQVTGLGGSTGVTLVETYDLTPVGDVPTVSVTATVSATDVNGSGPAVITFTRTGDTSKPLTVSYVLGGSATRDLDYAVPSGTVTFAEGAATSTLTITAQGNGGGISSKSVIVSLPIGVAFNVGASRSASVTLIYDRSSLFVARLRTPASTTSTAYGTATVRLSSDETSIVTSVDLSNLSSPQTTAYLRLGTPGDAGAPYLVRLANGQVNSAVTFLQPVGDYSVADIVKALKEGRIFISIGTAANPDAELAGTFVRGAGSQTLTPPAAPPALDLSKITPNDAARFLTQATFGPRVGDIEALIAKGYSAWLDEQIAKPASLHREGTMADFAKTPPADDKQPSGRSTTPNGSNRQAAWFKIAVDGDDQLRQRVAFALSEIFVISDTDTNLNLAQEGVSNFYDILVRNAFGNFRTLLEDVTLNPIMGRYLSHLRNAKASSTTGAQPDENYAREIMQLFTIGLNELLPDGTLKLDSDGLPIATYDQKTITEMARVFTGWSYFSTASNASFRNSPSNQFASMMVFPAFHDDGEKTIVGGRVLPANQGGNKDLADTLDTLVNHPNTAPFISRRLIQRLVTSNPSPGYVYRVAQVFENNGRGGRGDLAAVVKAILLDYEARAPQMLDNPAYGKLKEPLLRLTALMRAHRAYSEAGRYYNPNPEVDLAQAALRSPTVFNFFDPDYVQPGPLAEAGLYVPEYQILNDTTAISNLNHFHALIWVKNPVERTVRLNLDDVLPLATQPEALVDRMSLVFTSGQMRPATRERILKALAALPGNTTPTDRVRTAIYLTIASPDAAIQR